MTTTILRDLQFLQISNLQVETLYRVCHNVLLGTHFKKIGRSSDSKFLLTDSDGNSEIVEWRTMCLVILPRALGIRNVIINVDCPMHPADYIIEEFKKSQNPETVNEVK